MPKGAARILLASLMLYVACARNPNTFMDYQYEYPRLQSETCDGSSAKAFIHLVARDVAGAALGGATAYLLPAEGLPSTAAVEVEVTDASGVATFEALGNQPYALTVLMRGFEPVTRLTLVSPGCRGNVTVELSVAPPG